MKKYFSTYAHPEIHKWINQIPSEKYLTSVVIPARDEGSAFLSNLNSLDVTAGRKKILKIIVINSSTDSSPAVIEQNAKLARALSKRAHCFVIDTLLTAKEGVGSARRMGCDLAALMVENGIAESPYFFTTDADVFFPKDYFKVLETATDESALIFPFRHFSESSHQLERLSVELYDLSLRYYVAGLAYAHSPYAFHTVGSTLCLRADAYIDVRGFPKRPAGEDFYLLNKLAKVGRIRSLESPHLEISGRLSNRVPFGTGVGVRRFLTDLKLHREPLFYDPRVFVRLKEKLESFSRAAETQKLKANAEPELKKLFKNFSASKRLLPEIHNWFDAFKTLKFIHQVRDEEYPSLAWHEAIHCAPFKVSVPTTGPQNIKALEG